MPKQKTNRAAAKRFSATKTGKLKRHKAYKRHCLTQKSPKRRRNLRQATVLSGPDERRVKAMLPHL